MISQSGNFPRASGRMSALRGSRTLFKTSSVMRFIRAVLILFSVLGGPGPGSLPQVHAAQPAVVRALESDQSAAKEEHGVPQKAEKIGQPFGFPITNSMLVSWVVAVGLIIFARVAMRKAKE